MLRNCNYLIHSSKGTTWEKKDHKYVEKVMGDNGKYYYIYDNGSVTEDEDEADAYEKGRKVQETEKTAEKIYNSTPSRAKDRVNIATWAINTIKNNTGEAGKRKRAKQLTEDANNQSMTEYGIKNANGDTRKEVIDNAIKSGNAKEAADQARKRRQYIESHSRNK